MTLFTFGYEGLPLDAFITRLKAKKIEVVVDVRETPISRKKGFSKSAFGEALRAAGIEYVHLPTFGCPKAVRDQYKLNQSWSEYTIGFEAYLTTIKPEINEFAQFAKQRTSCLVCFEADYNFCHRSMVAREVANAAGDLSVAHITAKTVIPVGKPRVAA